MTTTNYEARYGDAIAENFDKYVVPISKDEHIRHQKKVMNLLVQAIEAEAQEITLTAGDAVVFNAKGTMTKRFDIDAWEDDDFNFFLATFTLQTTPSRNPSLPNNWQSKLADPSISGGDHFSYIDTKFFESSLDDHGMSFDFSLSFKNKVLRIHAVSMYNPKAQGTRKEKYTFTIRVVPNYIMTYEESNLPKVFKQVESMKSGLVLISGHTGSGKSTTVATIVNEINRNPEFRKTILTIEEPIEYVHESAESVIIQREVGLNKNVPTFERAIIDSLRENVDIIVIGEARTASEMENALRAAETGKLVILTIHSNGVADTIDRIVNSFPGDIQNNIKARLAEDVVAILHQSLETMTVPTTVVDPETTVNTVVDLKVQIPVVSGILITNDTNKSTFRKNIERVSLSKLIKDQPKSWCVSHEDAYKELVERGVVEDTEENRHRLVPAI